MLVLPNVYSRVMLNAKKPSIKLFKMIEYSQHGILDPANTKFQKSINLITPE
jgi:hypothetical protein